MDLGGRLVLPGLVDTHIHLDKACLDNRCPCGGSLQDAVKSVSEAKRDFTEADVYARAGPGSGDGRLPRHQPHADPRRGRPARGPHEPQGAAPAQARLCLGDRPAALRLPAGGAARRPRVRRGGWWRPSTSARTSFGRRPLHRQGQPRADRAHLRPGGGARPSTSTSTSTSRSTPPASTSTRCAGRRTSGAGAGRTAVGHATKLSALPPERLAATARRLADAGVAVTVLPATDLFLMGAGRRPRRAAGHGAGASPGQGGRHLLGGDQQRPQPVHAPTATARWRAWRTSSPTWRRSPARTTLAACLDLVTDSAARLMRLADYRVAVGGPRHLRGLRRGRAGRRSWRGSSPPRSASRTGGRRSCARRRG